MTSLPVPSFTTDRDTIVDAVGNNDTTFELGAGYGAVFTSLQLTEGDTLDGGAGIDILRIVQSDPNGYDFLDVDLTSFASLTGIENIVIAGNANSEALIRADQRSLADVELIDGGLSNTTLLLEGGVIDLRGKTLVNISSIIFSDPAPTILFDNVEIARPSWPSFPGSTTM
ncbi:hypothetical protein AAII07_17665 [Microvirga sp. 0TCS3.31]